MGNQLGIQCSCCDRDKDNGDQDKTFQWLVSATDIAQALEKGAAKKLAAEATVSEPSTAATTPDNSPPTPEEMPPAADVNDGGAGGVGALDFLQGKLADLFGGTSAAKEREAVSVTETKRLRRSRPFSVAPDGKLVSNSRRKSSWIPELKTPTSQGIHSLLSEDSTPASKGSTRCDSEDTAKPKVRRRRRGHRPTAVAPEVEDVLEVHDYQNLAARLSVLEKFTSSGGRKRRGDRRHRASG